MKKILSFVIVLMGFSAPVYAQVPAVNLSLTVTNESGGSKALSFGIDPSATDSIDPIFGENELPPLPPTGVFDARFINPNDSISLGEGSLKDYRTGGPGANVTKIYQIQYQQASGTSKMTINWNLPAGVKGRLQDAILGSLIDVQMSGNGSFTVTDPGVYNKLKMTMMYSLPAIVSPSVLPNALLYTAYSETLSVKGGTPPYTWVVSSDFLPSAISLSSTGILSGPPVETGAKNFTIRVTDANSAFAEKRFSLSTIVPELKIVTDSVLSDAAAGSFFGQTLLADGIPPFSWRITDGNFAEGLSLTQSGCISGQPITAGIYHVKLEVEDAAYHKVSKSFTQTVYNLVPVIKGIWDSVKTVGDKGFTLRIWGGNFSTSSVVHVNAAARPTMYVDSALIDTEIADADLSHEGKLNITVVNDAPGGGISNIWYVYVVKSTDVPKNNISGMPTVYYLDQNFPNPFNPSTTIRFGVPTQSYVTLTVYDGLGRKAAALVDGDVPAGNHAVEFDAGHLASGIYLYRLTAVPHGGAKAKSFILMRKFVLIR